jgi:hypothetical protein
MAHSWVRAGISSQRDVASRVCFPAGLLCKGQMVPEQQSDSLRLDAQAAGVSGIKSRVTAIKMAWARRTGGILALFPQ